jgi:hypothetical protein
VGGSEASAAPLLRPLLEAEGSDSGGIRRSLSQRSDLSVGDAERAAVLQLLESAGADRASTSSRSTASDSPSGDDDAVQQRQQQSGGLAQSGTAKRAANGGGGGGRAAGPVAALGAAAASPPLTPWRQAERYSETPEISDLPITLVNKLQFFARPPLAVAAAAGGFR